MLNTENDHYDGEDKNGDPGDNVLDHCLDFCTIKLNHFRLLLLYPSFFSPGLSSDVFHIDAHTKLFRLFSENLQHFRIEIVFKLLWYQLSRKRSVINFCLGFTAYFSRSLTPSCFNTSSSRKKFPEHSVDGLRKI